MTGRSLDVQQKPEVTNGILLQMRKQIPATSTREVGFQNALLDTFIIRKKTKVFNILQKYTPLEFLEHLMV